MFGRHFTLAAGQQLFFDTRNRRIHVFGADGAFAQRQAQAGAQLDGIVVAAAAVALHDGRHGELNPFIGGEALVTGQATAAATNGIALFRDPAVDNLRFGMAAKWTPHVCSL
ncbi:hypothetical protein D3C78_1204310 [compost metagenome]